MARLSHPARQIIYQYAGSCRRCHERALRVVYPRAPAAPARPACTRFHTGVRMTRDEAIGNLSRRTSSMTAARRR